MDTSNPSCACKARGGIARFALARITEDDEILRLRARPAPRLDAPAEQQQRGHETHDGDNETDGAWEQQHFHLYLIIYLENRLRDPTNARQT
jgi:hypothetical protein